MDPYAQPTEVDILLGGFPSGQHLVVDGANFMGSWVPIMEPQ